MRGPLSIILGGDGHDTRMWCAIPGWGGNDMGLGGDRNLGFHGHPGILGTLSSAGWSRGRGVTPSSFLYCTVPPKKNPGEGEPRDSFQTGQHVCDGV